MSTREQRDERMREAAIVSEFSGEAAEGNTRSQDALIGETL